jgi:SAM-dependent methyltransferase
VHSDQGEPEVLPAAHFFRAPHELPEVERVALDRSRGRVLDVGAGAGAHALPLQERGLEVTALDPLPDAVRVMKERGVRRALEGDLHDPPPGLAEEGGFDTILLLMNGVGIAGTLRGIGRLLDSAGALLGAGGHILIDSTDLGEPREVQYQLEYRGERGEPYPWLFVGPDRLAARARRHGWRSELLFETPEGAYLAGLTR